MGRRSGSGQEHRSTDMSRTCRPASGSPMVRQAAIPLALCSSRRRMARRIRFGRDWTLPSPTSPEFLSSSRSLGMMGIAAIPSTNLTCNRICPRSKRQSSKPKIRPQSSWTPLPATWARRIPANAGRYSPRADAAGEDGGKVQCRHFGHLALEQNHRPRDGPRYRQPGFRGAGPSGLDRRQGQKQ